MFAQRFALDDWLITRPDTISALRACPASSRTRDRAFVTREFLAWLTARASVQPRTRATPLAAIVRAPWVIVFHCVVTPSVKVLNAPRAEVICAFPQRTADRLN